MAREYAYRRLPDGSIKARGSKEMFVAGAISAAAGTATLYNFFGESLKILAVCISVGTAPTGADLICDFNINGTTIFTTQSNRPRITAGSKSSGKVTTMDVTAWPDGQALSIDVDQVGSTVTGSYLTAQVFFA